MLTLHPTAKQTGDGYRPMIIVRNARGQCVGSRTCRAAPISFKFFAETIALIAARNAASKNPTTLQLA